MIYSRISLPVQLVVGVATILKQFHPSYTGDVLAMLGQYVRHSVHTCFAKSDKPGALPADVVRVLHVVSLFCRLTKIPREHLDAVIPSYIFDSLMI